MIRRAFLRTGLLAASASLLGARNAFSQYDLIPIQVRPGDTLPGLALMNDTDVETIRELNQLTGNLIRPGQVLFVPRPAPVDETDPALAPLIEANQGLVIEKDHWKYLVAHHSATPTGNAEIFGQYHSNIRHMENGLAYHFVIGNGSKSEDGQLEVGQRWIKQLHGGHVHSDELNKIAIGICLVGNFESQQPTDKQVKTANALIDYLMQTVIPNPCEFTSHKEIQPHSTLCPGRFFPLEQMHERFG